MARIFGYGHVVVTGTGDAVIRFPAMAHPVAFRRSIEAARALERAVAANDPAPEEHAQVEERPRERPRKHSSFIGLRKRS
jgi:hypothetical protein